MRYSAIIILLFVTTLASAQSPDEGRYGRFVIGADNVGPSTPMPYPNAVGNGGTFPQWVVDSETTGGGTPPDVNTWLPWERW